MIVESYKNLYDCGADIIIDIVGMQGDCYPGYSIDAQCLGAGLAFQQVYNKYRPQEHWGHCYMADCRCQLRETGRVWVALLSASDYNNKRKDCVANLKHLESALKELNDWIEQNGNNMSVCIQYKCGAGWDYEWEPILEILNRTLPDRKVIVTHGFNSETPLPNDYGKPKEQKHNWFLELLDFIFK